jgi:hypothetical protein
VILLAADPSHPILDPATTESLIGFCSVVLAFLAIFMTVNGLRNRRDVKAVRNQVENSHTVNLRDDQDDKHSASTTMQGRILDRIAELGASMDHQFIAVRKDIQRLNDHDDRDDKRIRDLEDTATHKTRPRTTKSKEQ